MPRLPEAFIDGVRSANDVETVISSYVDLRRRGKTLTGLCPFHNEKTPSFTVYPDTQSYYCFGCGAGGDVITFIRNVENLDYIEAVKLLADRAGMRMPEETYDDGTANLRRRIYEANREAAGFFHRTLFTEQGRQQLEYLQRRRVSPSMIKHFGLGAAPDDWHALGDYLQSKGFRRDELVAANLMRTTEKNGKKYYFDAFRGKVMFPVIDVRGNVVAFGGRVLDNSKPKYINTSDTLVYKKSNELFALNFAKNGNSRQLILCEGYMDVIALHSAGFTNAVAGLGTALTSEQVNVISRYADEVCLCYDSDEAGQKAVRAAMALFSKTGVHVKVVRLDGGKDPDEIIREFGKDRFEKMLKAADNDIEYKLSKLKEKYIVETSDGKIGYLKDAVKLLAGCDSLTRDVYASRLSDELGVAKDAIVNQLKSAVKNNARKDERERLDAARKQSSMLEKAADPSRAKNMRASRAEDSILITLLNNASFYRELSGKLNEDLFITPVNKRIFTVMKERLENGGSVDISHLSANLTNDETGNVARLLANSALVSNTVAECEDCIRVLEEEKRKRSVADISQMTSEEMLAYINSLKKES